MDFECYDSALHPDIKKRDQIWVNIGTEFGSDADLTMGYGEISNDGFYEDYVAFAMNTAEEIDQLISMLNEAKDLLAAYREEFNLDEIETEDDQEPTA